jgi:hypothetical protein
MPEEDLTAKKQSAQSNQEENENQSANETFEGWLDAQPEEVKSKVKTLYEAHTSGLQSALKSEREARGKAEKDLRELAKKQEKGSELEAALTKQADQLAALERQAAFQDKAHAAGVRNLKLAYLAASQAELVDAKGNCDFGKLKTEYPELFAAPPPPDGNAGNGTGGRQGGSQDMNVMLRQALRPGS